MYRKSQKRLEQLYEYDIFTKEDLKKIRNLAGSKNPQIRADAAILLARQYDRQSEWILYKLTFDRVEIVRLEAGDSLCIGKELFTVQRLEKLCGNSDAVMRQFALQSHFDVFINVFGHTEETRKDILDGLIICLRRKKMRW